MGKIPASGVRIPPSPARPRGPCEASSRGDGSFKVPARAPDLSSFASVSCLGCSPWPRTRALPEAVDQAAAARPRARGAASAIGRCRAWRYWSPCRRRRCAPRMEIHLAAVRVAVHDRGRQLLALEDEASARSAAQAATNWSAGITRSRSVRRDWRPWRSPQPPSTHASTPRASRSTASTPSACSFSSTLQGQSWMRAMRSSRLSTLTSMPPRRTS